LSTAQPRAIEGLFRDFYSELLRLLPPKYQPKNQGAWNKFAIENLYLGVRDYLASQRVLIIFHEGRSFGIPGLLEQKVYTHYAFDVPHLLYIEAIGPLGVPIVRPLTQTLSRFHPATRGYTVNGIPFIISERSREHIAGIRALIARDPDAGPLIAPLFAQHVNDEGRSAAVELTTAWEEKQHADDFISLGARNEERLELRAKIVAFRHAPWDSLIILLSTKQGSGKPSAPGVEEQILNAAIAIINEAPDKFAGIVAAAEGKRTEKDIVAQLYKLADPAYANALRRLTQRLSEEFGFPGLFRDEAPAPTPAS
jgi:hypothetical protein